jgi:hypothetical protein
MSCDTLFIDTDRELCALVWRGDFEVGSLDAGEVLRIVVSLEPETLPRTMTEIRRELPRAKFCYAIEPSDLAPGAAPPPEESDELMVARLMTWEHPEAPDPSISLAEYAAVAAELAEQREPRGEVLKRHGFDEYYFTLEERAWLERLASAGASGDAALLVDYGQAYNEAQDRLARPGEEGRWSLADYAAMKVGMELRDPKQILQNWSVTMPEWLRLSRRWRRAIKEDRVLAAEHDRLLVEERARVKSSGAPRASREGE